MILYPRTLCTVKSPLRARLSESRLRIRFVSLVQGQHQQDLRPGPNEPLCKVQRATSRCRLGEVLHAAVARWSRDTSLECLTAHAKVRSPAKRIHSAALRLLQIVRAFLRRPAHDCMTTVTCQTGARNSHDASFACAGSVVVGPQSMSLHSCRQPPRAPVDPLHRSLRLTFRGCWPTFTSIPRRCPTWARRRQRAKRAAPSLQAQAAAAPSLLQKVGIDQHHILCGRAQVLEGEALEHAAA